MIDIFRGLSSKQASYLQLPDALLLLCLAYCLAANYNHTLQGGTPGDASSSPWHADQESAIKVAQPLELLLVCQAFLPCSELLQCCSLQS